MAGSLNYDQRIAYLKDWFGKEILIRFNMPKDLDPKVVAMDTIEAVNRNLPNGIDKERMGHLVASIAKEVAQSATSRTLPPIKAFLDACKNTSRSHGKASQTPNSYSLDPFLIAAKSIASNNRISESFLKGEMRAKLIKEYGVTEESLEPYDNWLEFAAHKQ